MLVATKLLSQQNYVCRDKYLSRLKYFVATSILLSRQKLYLWQLPPMIVKHGEMFAFADEVMGLNFRYPCHTCLLFFKSIFTMLVNAASVIVERITVPLSV